MDCHFSFFSMRFPPPYFKLIDPEVMRDLMPDGIIYDFPNRVGVFTGFFFNRFLINRYRVGQSAANAVPGPALGLGHADVAAEKCLLTIKAFFLPHRRRRFIFDKECHIINKLPELFRYFLKSFPHKFFKRISIHSFIISRVQSRGEHGFVYFA